MQKDGETWTLVLVRDLPHPPTQVWKALTDPEQLREWAPFDSDQNLGAVGSAKLSTVLMVIKKSCVERSSSRYFFPGTPMTLIAIPRAWL